jgi:small-conductance mechanosensitive channel
MEQERLAFLILSSALIVVLTTLGLLAVHFAARRALNWAQSMGQTPEGRRQQLITLIHLSRWTLNVVLVISAVMMLLGTFGIDFAPLLASAGVAGLAVSLGAQTLIKDLIGGLLILIENQYAIGDIIEVGQVSGQVERITLRTTEIRDVNGQLYIVPNGEVRVVGNQTSDWSRAVVDIGVAYEEDLDRALRVLEESVNAFGQDPAVEPSLLETPQVLGPMSLGDSAITVRVMVNTRPGKHLEVGRKLRAFLLAVCEREGIELPYPRQEVLVRGLEQAAAGPLER